MAVFKSVNSIALIMRFEEIDEKLRQGKYIVWVDDKQNLPLTPEYIETHLVSIVESPDYGFDLCKRLQDSEREKNGRAMTRYRISGMDEDYVSSEDLEPENVAEIIKELPIAEEDKEHAIKQLKNT